MNTRRHFLGAAAALVAAGAASRNALAAAPEPHQYNSAETAAPLHPQAGRPYNPVVTLNGWSLPFRMKDGVKEFHLVAEPVVREISPGMTAKLWGYNGSSPGPTIEAVEGDRVRLFVTNKLPEHTTVHWHGLILPNGMDGVGGLTQPQIAPGQTFVYEFELRKSGTFMYHPHADEMVQMAMGAMGLFIVHPKNPRQMAVDRDYAFLINAYDIDPGSSVPKVNTMLDFNLWTWNSRAFPGIAPLVARTGERVRIRMGNLTMTNHPIHLHGHVFEVAGTDGGWVPKSARWPEVTVDIAVGQMRAIEFIADNPGDWAFHCHKSHHTMNAMGHSVPTMIGVQQGDLTPALQKLLPDYMAMGSQGMAEMATMDMPLPDNTLPMMTGRGPYGSVEMGGMFSVLKVRDDLAHGDYRDPGWYRMPPGTQAHAVPTADLPPARTDPTEPQATQDTLQVRKPQQHAH
ncbi:MAG: copper oxidase [Thiomonas sp. 20-64-9]|jgi:FtsP/CotA-like multicopper oxidase with cupredoxin domain|uniref:multicopper oxidase family protein n=1 Tax=unclassified Thiomonas TaxID=2625466 RepID=UPI000BC5E8DD|nr:MULTISPECIES: copper oxidase [unclassified Thiomonas]OYV30833.1 MAG: copper oxidase [Thiomonas sp. 20-64-9]OZB71258.1 MAG: copper oxidase [Thiomonas sp. 13-64-67]